MDTQLVLENGLTIQVHGRPDQGTRHEILYGTLPGSGEPVVIKLERTVGALQREAVALATLSGYHGLAPRLLFSGFAELDTQRVRCLVTERCEGLPPTTPGGWWRMGRALGRLVDARLPLTCLPVTDAVTFGQQHVERARELGDRLARLRAAIPDWGTLTSADVPLSMPLVITHGDPGPGNFLDDGRDGMLVDWEEAHVAPQGLDLARLRFIALLGAGPAGYVARDHQERLSSATDGYRRALSHPVSQPLAQTRWWTAVAGIQFIHRRWELGGPAPWEDAAQVLLTALT